MATRSENNDKGEGIDRSIPFLNAYTVFNAEQIDGLPALYHQPAAAPLDPVSHDRQADAFFGATGSTLHHGGDRAYYALGSDHVQMPPYQALRDAESYYATLAHEHVHWTRHPSRLDRDLGRKK